MKNQMIKEGNLRLNKKMQTQQKRKMQGELQLVEKHGKLVKKILSEWLYENFYPTETRKRPIPTKAEKRMLAKKTGLTQTQVTDWFVNARARLWKPRVEGIVRSVVDELKNKRNVNTSTPVVV